MTWAVNGGQSITSSGLFTSNGTPGTFFVTATSVADPSEVGVAQVTVGRTLTLTCSDGAFNLFVNVQRAGGTVTVGVTATVPPGRAQLISYSGNFGIEPAATGTLTVTAQPGWRQGIGDVNYAISAAPTTGASVVSNFDFRNGSVFASTGPASVQVTGTGAGHAVDVSFSMFCNGSCSRNGPGAGRMAVTLHSAVSGRELQTVVDAHGVSPATFNVADGQRWCHFAIEYAPRHDL